MMRHTLISAARCSSYHLRGMIHATIPAVHVAAPSLAPARSFRSGRQAGWVLAAAAADGTPALAAQLKEDMKIAMKAKDAMKLGAIRFLNAAIKSREIELREKGTALTDADIIGVIQKMAKQRRDSIDSYIAGGRPDLVEQEQQELAVLESYLPAQMSREELEVLVAEAVAAVGATSVKQMGAVMKIVQGKTQGRADNRTINELIKAKLSG